MLCPRSGSQVTSLVMNWTFARTPLHICTELNADVCLHQRQVNMSDRGNKVMLMRLGQTHYY